MARHIKNRREDLYINEVPPEILDETTLDADGFVKNTDYATTTVGGVVKVSASQGTNMSAGGVLFGTTRTLEQYNAAAGTMLVCKGTIENVIFDVVKAKIQSDMGALYESADIGDTWTVVLRKTADGLVFDYAATE